MRAATEAERAVVKKGLAQIPTGDETMGLVKLDRWIEDGRALVLNGWVLAANGWP